MEKQVEMTGAEIAAKMESDGWVKVTPAEETAVRAGRPVFNGCTHVYLRERFGEENVRHVPGFGWMRRTVAADLRVGDIVDLEGDKFADRNNDNIDFEYEYQTVAEVNHDTCEYQDGDCIAIGFEGFGTVGFPPDHPVKRVGRDPGYGP